MHAIISDIHGNLEALEAVLAHINCPNVLCLGDVVCYGPDSIECVRKSAHWRSVVAGPLDLALVNHEQNLWSRTLNRHIEQTRRQFSNAPDAQALFQLLKSYRSEYSTDGIWFFHGTPRNVRNWIFPEDVYLPAKLDRLVVSSEYAFIGGGSHIPGIFRRLNNGWEFVVPENGKSYDLPPSGKTIITVGSVGQPRDGDHRAAYAILNDATIVFNRVDYDMETTRTKINNDPDIDDMHADRLPHGR